MFPHQADSIKKDKNTQKELRRKSLQKKNYKNASYQGRIRDLSDWDARYISDPKKSKKRAAGENLFKIDIFSCYALGFLTL